MPISLAAAVAVVVATAPITEVTVFSDRARVVRTARTQITGRAQIDLPLLPGTVDAASIRVAATGGVVERVDIVRVEAVDLPRDEANRLVAEIEKLDDQIARTRGEREAVTAGLQALDRIKPRPLPEDLERPLPKLNPAGWGAALGFLGTSREKLHARGLDLDEKLVDLGREREALVERARRLQAERSGGWRVIPHLSGDGAAELTVSYLVGRARWYPSYDLQLNPDTGKVRVAFSGRVSQESGEDWNDARLKLSTALPATSTRLPPLPTWKIGERDRFMPAPPPLGTERAVAKVNTQDRDADGILDEVDGCPDGAAGADTTDGCPPVDAGGRLRELEKRVDQLKETLARTQVDAPKIPNAPASPAPPTKRSASKGAKTVYDFDQDVVEGSMIRPDGAFVDSGSGDSYGTLAVEDVQVVRRSPGRFVAREEPPPVAVGIAPPAAWRPPSYAPDLPASLAGGYDLMFPSLRPETVRSGQGARRVALFAESWPVSVERRVFPALARHAYLTAEIKNPSERVLPGGPAELFVGDDAAGTARLDVVAPGETFTLPLGVDRAVKPVRNVKLTTSERGVINKEEINEYLVVDEVANPYRVPIQLRIVDQWPIPADKKVASKLERADRAKQDWEKGELEWLLTVPPGGKEQVSFTFTLRRPKGWRLHQ